MSETTTARASVKRAEKYQVTDNELKHRSQELGLVGKLFGSSENAPINVAGTIVVAGILGLIVAACISTPLQGDLIKTFSSMILAALTFLGGYLGGRHKRGMD